jgi:hypothetical protein
MSKKIADLAVKVGTYLKDGKEKGRYKNCGIILQKEDGGKMTMIDPTFNFAAVKLAEGRDYVILSEFEVKDGNGQAAAPVQQQAVSFDE